MPTYTFRNKKTDEKYDKIMSYEEMLKYKKQSNIEQVLVAPKLFKLNDVGGAEDNFRQWCRQPADNIDISKSKILDNLKTNICMEIKKIQIKIRE